MTYAKGTETTVERTRAELEAMLIRYGASQRIVGENDETSEAWVGFTMQARQVKLTIPLPKIEDVKFPKAARDKSEARKRKLLEQSKRERWRAVVLLVKAKLETIALGLSTVEREFLADLVLVDGQTLHGALREDIRKMYVTGAPPRFLLGSGT